VRPGRLTKAKTEVSSRRTGRIAWGGWGISKKKRREKIKKNPGRFKLGERRAFETWDVNLCPAYGKRKSDKGRIWLVEAKNCRKEKGG